MDSNLNFLFCLILDVSDDSDLICLDLASNEDFSFNLELQSRNTKAMPQFKLCLFSLEYAVHLYCAQGIAKLGAKNNVDFNSTDNKTAEVQLEVVFSRILHNVAVMQQGNAVNFDSFDHQLSTSSSVNLFNRSLIGSKTKVSQDDLIRLLKDAIKCSIVDIKPEFETQKGSLES